MNEDLTRLNCNANTLALIIDVMLISICFWLRQRSRLSVLSDRLIPFYTIATSENNTFILHIILREPLRSINDPDFVL
ncbi:hypothetical protein NQ317_000762 [Molorchus minor]|uniref:Uncharacterized protein n=1 Tax=Molorchus minor TaxID=1323400 RepID=A0ABQ9IYQ0_9CUCU|nr:hypothetical protein NQ317_000762 [Molorchus minor]